MSYSLRRRGRSPASSAEEGEIPEISHLEIVVSDPRLIIEETHAPIPRDPIETTPSPASTTTALPIPPRIPVAVPPISPTSAVNILNAYNSQQPQILTDGTPNPRALSPSMYRAIVKNLVQTIKTRDEKHCKSVKDLEFEVGETKVALADVKSSTTATTITRLEERIKQLESKVAEEDRNDNDPPEGYVRNHGQVDSVGIPIGDGFEALAKFVKRMPGDPSKAVVLTGLIKNENPQVISLYAAPVLDLHQEVEPLPNWLMRVLAADSLGYAKTIRDADTLEDWGLTAELHRYHQVDRRIAEIWDLNSQLVRELEGLEDERQRSRYRLEAANAGGRLARLGGAEAFPQRHLQSRSNLASDSDFGRPYRKSKRGRFAPM
jgi:hypothetical protein